MLIEWHLRLFVTTTTTQNRNSIVLVIILKHRAPALYSFIRDEFKLKIAINVNKIRFIYLLKLFKKKNYLFFRPKLNVTYYVCDHRNAMDFQN
jgi:hypothetical protein